MTENRDMRQGGIGNQQAGGDIYNIDQLNLALTGLGNHPTKIARVISLLSAEVNADIPDDYSAVSFYKIEQKIQHNRVIAFKPMIDRYGYYGATVESVCEKLDIDKPNSKSRMFEYIKHLYLTERARVCQGLAEEDCLQAIQDHADNIISAVHEKLLEVVKGSDDLEGLDVEDIHACLCALLAVAFINCQILERPPTTPV